MPNLIGTAPNQVPTNGALGNMAFQNKEAVSVDTLVTTALTVTGTGALTVGGTQIVKDASGNVGLGVTPSAWGSGWTALQLPGGSLMSQSATGFTNLLSNAFYNGTNYIYVTAAPATSYRQNNGSHVWNIAATGTVGNAISFTQAMTLDASGNLGVGTSSPAGKLHVASGRIFLDADFSVSWQSGGVNRSRIVGDNVNSIIFENGSGNTERMRITDTGNVGIGNSAPTDKLSVNGTTYLQGITTHAANVALANNYLIAPVLKAYSEDKTTNATTTGSVTLDLSTTNVFDLTLTGNTTLTFSNPPASTRVFSFSIIAKQDATGGRTITWPASKKFAGGVAPPATTTANAIDVWSVMTYDGGTSYIISLSVRDAK